MAGPSHHGGHEGVRPADADDQRQRSGSQGAVTNDPQVALPSLRRDPRLVLEVLPLLPLDPVSARPLHGTAGFTRASVGDQLPTPQSNGLPQLFPASQQPANLPSHGGRANSHPARSRLNRRGTRRPANEGGRQDGGEQARRLANEGGRQDGGEQGHDRANQRLRDNIRDRIRDRIRRGRESELFTELRIISGNASRMAPRASILEGAIDYIGTLESALETALGPRVQLPAANTGLVCFDHTGDPNAVTAVATQPAPGSAPSPMASYLGHNVAMHVCGRGCFIIVMFPFRDPSHGLYFHIRDVLSRRGVDIMSAFIYTRDGTAIYFIHGQARPTVMMSYNLHEALQNVVSFEIYRTNQA